MIHPHLSLRAALIIWFSVPYWLGTRTCEKREEGKTTTKVSPASDQRLRVTSYTPESFCVANSIFRFHSHRSGWCRTVNLWSPEKTKFSDVKMCRSRLRIHDTYKRGKNKQKRKRMNKETEKRYSIVFTSIVNGCWSCYKTHSVRYRFDDWNNKKGI